MNIINGIARGVSPRVRAPPSLAAEERMLRERSTYEKVVCAECMKTCLGGKNSVVKFRVKRLPSACIYYVHAQKWRFHSERAHS